MATQVGPTISVDEAARLLFRCEHPTAKQAGEVRELIRRGALEGNRGGHWTTTRKAVAQFLAAQALRKSDRASNPLSRYDSDASHDGQMRGVYRDLLQDYILTVFTRRRSHQRSTTFQRAVLAARVLCLALLIGVGALVVRHSLSDTTSREQAAVEHWIEQNSERFRIVRWFPSRPHDEGGVALRVQYKYFPAGRKGVLTDRVFLVQNGVVTLHDDD